MLRRLSLAFLTLLLLAPRAGRAQVVVEPSVLGSEDSDGNRVLRAGLAGWRQATPATRLRFDGGVKRTEDLAGWAVTGDVLGGLRWAPRAGFTLDATVGGTFLGATADTVVRFITTRGSRGGPPQSVAVRQLVEADGAVMPTGMLRARWRATPDGVGGSLGARRTVLDATPLLVSSRVARNEASGTLDLPLPGPLRARGGGSIALVDSRIDERTRHALDAALAVRVRPWLELSAQAHRVGVDSATDAGWFAPRRADVAELGAAVEHEWESGVALSLDAGAGAQRVQRFEEPLGDWARALRLWGSVSWPLAPGRGLRAEVEMYDSLLGSVAGSAEGWSYASVSLGGWFSVGR